VAAPAIRPATARDVAHLVILVDIAAKGFAAHLWRLAAAPGQSALEVGRSRALRDVGAFTWRHAHLAEGAGDVAGLLVGYPIADPVDPADIADAPEPIRALAELEALAPGAWYVNVLAVYPEYRGRGVGTALLARAELLARAAGARAMAIIVASANAAALRLYRRSGYVEQARRPVAEAIGHRGEWILLTRPLPAAP
jgi:ribosomal protein S18 acetylase RimI-like enzyme